MSTRRKDRWYSMAGQRRIHRHALESAKGPRHLISLAVMLILTLIAMRQVSDPQRVEGVAKAVGLLPQASEGRFAPPGTTPPSRAGNAKPAANSELGMTSESAMGSLSADPLDDRQLLAWTLVSTNPDVETESQILARLLDSAPAELISSMAYDVLIARDSQVPGIMRGPSPAQGGSDLAVRERADWLAFSKERVARWIELSDSLSREHDVLSSLWEFLDEMSMSPASLAISNAEPSSPKNSEEAFRLALERALLKQFADNTPWRTNERSPLVRSTQRAVQLGEAFQSGALVPELLPAIAVPQLMGETAALRGRAVRVSGRIALVDQKATLSFDDPRIRAYQVLWLRPDDGSNQPIIIHLPLSLKIAVEPFSNDQPIIVSGIVTKRRAYASQRGGDIAPVLVAAHIQSFDPRQPSESAPSPGSLEPIAARWRMPISASAWHPPVDYGGAMQRIDQRIGPRSKQLNESLRSLSFHDASQIEALVHDPQVQAVLYGINQVASDVELLAQADWKSGDVLSGDGPAGHIGMRRGMVTETRRIAIESEPFPGWPWKEIYACTLDLPSLDSPSSGELSTKEPAEKTPGSQCVVLTHSIPQAWLQASTLRQPAIAFGWIYEPPQGANRSVMISPSLQWRRWDATGWNERSHPDPSPSMALSPTLNRGWKSLLDRGWNLNSIDLIESLQGRPMTSRESQAFYSFLRCSAPPLDAPAERVPPPLSIMQTIQRAEKRKLERDSLHEDASSTGHRAHAIVQVRRVQRVEVSNPDEQRWLGASHYFQLDGFADIGNSRITIRYEQSGEPIVFEKEFPITLVARNVPADLLIDAEDAIPGDAQAWYPRTRVAIEGWVYRMWRFKTTQVSEATGDKELQQGPMLIVDRFATPPDPPSKGASNLTPAWVTGITTGIGVVGGLWILWQIRHHAKVPRRSRR